MVLETLLSPLAPRKASTGIGAVWMTNEPSIHSLSNDPQRMMKDAQAAANSNRWIRAAERVISHQFGTVAWHLEDLNNEEVTDESSPVLVAIRNVLEKPYRPLEGDPITATPRTRSGLWSLTARHMGVCGSAFWYLDQTDAQLGIPAQLLYINPARMTPAGTQRRLVGWVLDADQRGQGTPLDAKFVIHFTLEEPDDGFFPPGLVETAMNSVNVTRLADRHAQGAFGSGGKLPGVFSPKAGEGVLPPDVFQALERDLRAANEHPDAARRSIILRGPIDFTPTGATPEQLDLVAVESMARDDILGLWGVPLSQLGISTPAGLNSGSTKSYDEAALWQKAVGPRLRRFHEVVQFQFLDRLAERGVAVEMVIEEPTFDDDLPKFQLAEKAQNMPLRNVERRALIGLEPFGDPVLDNAVWVPLNIVELAQAPEAAAKAKLVPGLRKSVDNLLPRLKKDLTAYFNAQRAEVAGKVRKNAAHLAKKPTDTDSWWNQDEWDRRLVKVLTPYATQIANMSAQRASSMVGKAAFDDILGSPLFKRLLSRVGLRIKGINETTRDKVQTAIREGIEAGDGAAELGDRIEQAAAFDEYRAELIARTESERVLNESQLETFREFGVDRVVAIDGDGDEECAARDGQEFDLDEALTIEDHPNGTLDWSPVL